MGRPKGSRNKVYKGNDFEIVNGVVRVFCCKGNFIIDAEDIEIIKAYTWNISPAGYPQTRTREGREKSKGLYLHRLLLNAQEGDEIDHINKDRTYNRRRNLRFVSHSQNLHNAWELHPKNTSGFRGVSEIKHQDRAKRWHAYIDLPTGRKNKACSTFLQAVAQRKAWEREYDPSGLQKN